MAHEHEKRGKRKIMDALLECKIISPMLTEKKPLMCPASKDR